MNFEEDNNVLIHFDDNTIVGTTIRDIDGFKEALDDNCNYIHIGNGNAPLCTIRKDKIKFIMYKQEE